MRVLFDTNVLFAALATQGLCLEAVETGAQRCTVVTSEHLLEELTRALDRKLKLGPSSRAALVELRRLCEVVRPAPLSERVCRDRSDDHVLAAALAGKVDVVVTGDDDLLTLRSFRGISIVSPRKFLQSLEGTG